MIKKLQGLVDQLDKRINQEIDNASYPVFLGLRDVAFANELNRIQSAVSDWNKILEKYSELFPTKEDRFKDVLELVNHAGKPDSLAHELKRRFLSEDKAQLNYSGKSSKVNIDKMTDFIDIDESFQKSLDDLKDLIIKLRSDLGGYYKRMNPDQFYNSKKKSLELSDSYMNELKKAHSIFAYSSDDLRKVALSMKLVSWLDEMQRIGIHPRRLFDGLLIPNDLREYIQVTFNGPDQYSKVGYEILLQKERQSEVEIISVTKG